MRIALAFGFTLLVTPVIAEPWIVHNCYLPPICDTPHMGQAGGRLVAPGSKTFEYYCLDEDGGRVTDTFQLLDWSVGNRVNYRPNAGAADLQCTMYMYDTQAAYRRGRPFRQAKSRIGPRNNAH